MVRIYVVSVVDVMGPSGSGMMTMSRCIETGLHGKESDREV